MTPASSAALFLPRQRGLQAIGDDVACRDGACGTLTRVVVDPVARTLTHIVVEPEHRRGAARLVPLELVESTSNEILNLTKDQVSGSTAELDEPD
jgi:hypothetical protein